MACYHITSVYILGGFNVIMAFNFMKSCVDDDAIGKQHYSSYVCGDNLCDCTGFSARCDGNTEPLWYIPKLPNNITELNFSGNKLTVINSTTMRNASELNLKTLILINNSVNSISNDAFENLSSLHSLDLGKDPGMKVEEVASALSNLKENNIQCVSFSELRWKYLPEHMFYNLSYIRKIQISHNDLYQLDMKAFSGLRYLSSLILKHNFLHTFDIKGTALSELRVLNLDENLISYVPSFCNVIQKSVVPKLSDLNLSNNKIYIVRDKDFNCLPVLIKLSLEGNPIRTFENNFISSLPSLRNLNLYGTGSDKEIINIEQYAFNSSTLETVDLTDTDLQLMFMSYDPKWLFSNSPNLRNLLLKKSLLLRNDENDLVSLFSPIPNLKKLDIRYNEIQFLPEALFSRMTSLRELLLANNDIQSWNGLTLFGNYNMSLLDLSYNKILIINATSFPPSMLNNMKADSLDLKHNTYLCSCQTLDSVNWFRKHRRILRYYPNYYKCSLPSDVKNMKLEDYNPSPESCAEKNVALLVSVPMSIISIATLSIIILVYKCRWRLRYGIYLFSNRYKNYEQIEDHDRFVYTGFVIYSDDDRNWVHNELLHRIEDQEGFRLCIRLRDFDVGKVHVDNIVENMLISEKIIVVLSNNFAKDDWCQFQLLLAETRLLKQNVNMLVLLMLEEIQSDCLRPSLYQLVTERQFALWSQDETGNDLFWEQTLSQLRRPTVIN